MRGYQRQYLDNLARIVALQGPFEGLPESSGAFLLAHRQESCRQVRAIIEENTAMLRQQLFPVLDDIVSADEEEVRHLEDFARQLGSGGANQPDLVLHYSIRCALVTYARKWDKLDMLIQELYHAGLALFYMQEIMAVARYDTAGKWGCFLERPLPISNSMTVLKTQRRVDISTVPWATCLWPMAGPTGRMPSTSWMQCAVPYRF